MRNRFCLLALLLLPGSAMAAAPAGQPLSPDEIRTFVSGKTVREYVNGQLLRQVYYAPDGRAFLMKADRRHGLTEPSASQWKAQDQSLCRPGLPLARPCQPMSRLPDGTTRLYYGSDSGYVSLRVVDGDPDQMATRVQHYAANATVRGDMQAEERRGAMPGGSYLTGDEIRTLVAGKTLRETPAQHIGTADPPTLIYLAADGTGYLATNRGQTTWLGPWVIDGNRLCLQGAYWPCADFRRATDGKLIKESGGPRGTRSVELLDDDPEKVMETVANSYPYNQRINARKNLEPKSNEPAFLGDATLR